MQPYSLNSAFSTSSVSTRATNPTTSAASSSYKGSDTPDADTSQMINDHRPEIESTRRPQTTGHQPTTTAQLNRRRE